VLQRTRPRVNHTGTPDAHNFGYRNSNAVHVASPVVDFQKKHLKNTPVWQPEVNGSTSCW